MQFNKEGTEDGDALKNSFSKGLHKILLAFRSVRWVLLKIKRRWLVKVLLCYWLCSLQ